MAKEKKITEEELLKALNELEGAVDDDSDEDEEDMAKADDDESDEGSDEDEESMDDDDKKPMMKKKMVGKSHTRATPGMPDNTKQSNGGFEEQPSSEDPEHFETNADEEDPSGGQSMKSLVADNDTLRKGFEVSAFLEALTDATTESVDGLMKSQTEFQNEQREFNAKIQKALTAIGNMLLGAKKSMTDADEAPVVRPRSVVQKSQVNERFEENPAQQSFTKTQVLDALTDLAVKGEVPPLVVSAYETSEFLEPAYVGQVNAKLKSMFGSR